MKAAAQYKEQAELIQCSLMRIEEEQTVMKRSLCGCDLRLVEKTVDGYTQAVMDAKVALAEVEIKLIIAQAIEAGPVLPGGAVVTLRGRAF